MTSGVLLDLSGVLYDGDTAIPGAVDAVARLRDARMPLRFLTNTTSKPKAAIVEKLRGMGFPLEAGEVLTPAEAARDWLTDHDCAPHLLIHPDLSEDFDGLPEAAGTAVVLGDAGRYFTYERMNAAFRALSDGAPFLALAANRVFRDADGVLSLDAGAFVRALEYSSGTEPVLLGKPAAAFFRTGVRGMGLAPEDVAMIGDDAESDVAGALTAGIGAAFLVRTGKYRDGDEDRNEPHPTAVVDDIGAAVDRILGAG